MSKSPTFERLKARHAKHRLGRYFAHASVYAAAGVGAVAGARLFSSFEMFSGGSVVPVLAGVAVGVGLSVLGRLGMSWALKPIHVTADDFDAIEDELGGFDRNLLDVFQRCHGSRPMRDYDEFIGNALELCGPPDFNAAFFYLAQETGAIHGHILCYDFASVQRLVEANRMLEARELQGNSGAGSAYHFPDNRSRLDKALDRPVRFGAMVCGIGSLVTAVTTVAVFYAL